MYYQNKLFWIEGFVIIRNIIGGVDYKGVREIMKVSSGKTLSFPCSFYLEFKLFLGL